MSCCNMLSELSDEDFQVKCSGLLTSLLSVICVWNTPASTQHTQVTHAAFAGLLWWSHILFEGEVKMSGPWELVTVRRWLNDRVVHCNCHSIITILHKQVQLRTDKKRQKETLGIWTTNNLSCVLTLHRFLFVSWSRQKFNFINQTQHSRAVNLHLAKHA